MEIPLEASAASSFKYVIQLKHSNLFVFKLVNNIVQIYQEEPLATGKILANQ